MALCKLRMLLKLIVLLKGTLRPRLCCADAMLPKEHMNRDLESVRLKGKDRIQNSECAHHNQALPRVVAHLVHACTLEIDSEHPEL